MIEYNECFERWTTILKDAFSIDLETLKQVNETERIHNQINSVFVLPCIPSKLIKRENKQFLKTWQ